MDYRDYYETLGVPRDADEKAIKSAYRKLARKFHPDVNQGDAEAERRFKEINEAYEVLGDSDKRSKYDQFGKEFRRYQQQAGGAGGFDWGAWAPQQQTRTTYATPEDLEDVFGGSGFSDFFDALFGGARQSPRSARPRRGADLEHPLVISLHEAYQGTERLIDRDGRRLSVKIPPGVATGSKVRVAGGGGGGAAGGQAGHLYLAIQVRQDERFERRGDDLYNRVTVPLVTAVLGGEMNVATITGEVKLKIPPGTQPGQKVRLRGLGMPRLRDPKAHGDQFVTVEVRLPSRLSEEEKALFERLAELETPKTKE